MFTISTHLISNNTLDGAPASSSRLEMKPPSRPRRRRKKRGLQINTLSSHPRKLCSSGDILEDIKRAASPHLASIFFCIGSNNYCPIKCCLSFLGCCFCCLLNERNRVGCIDLFATMQHGKKKGRRRNKERREVRNCCAVCKVVCRRRFLFSTIYVLPYKGIPPTERGGGGESFLRENRILYLFCRLFWKL